MGNNTQFDYWWVVLQKIEFCKAELAHPRRYSNPWSLRYIPSDLPTKLQYTHTLNGTPDIRWRMMVVVVLAPNRRQAISNNHIDSTVTTWYHVKRITQNTYNITAIGCNHFPGRSAIRGFISYYWVCLLAAVTSYGDNSSKRPPGVSILLTELFQFVNTPSRSLSPRRKHNYDTKR